MTKNTTRLGGVFLALLVEIERRLLATVLWTVAINLAFPQKSESIMREAPLYKRIKKRQVPRCSVPCLFYL